jgi:predicted HicB family RNase H-like nuclease
MSKVLEYNGYQGSIEVSIEDNCVFGKILHIEDLVTYEADTPSELDAAFREAVDSYVAFCLEEGREPNKPFKGSFNVRVGAGLHRIAALFAARQGQTLNELVKESLEERIARGDSNAYTIVHNHNSTYVINTEAGNNEYSDEEGKSWEKEALAL